MAKWWQGSTHSTDKVEPPESYEATPKSPQLLYDWAEYHFNFSQEKVKKIMSAHNITHFKVDAWWTYTELIRQEWEEDQALNSMPEHCPICGAPTERDRGRDGLFGVKYGWICTIDRCHFIQERINVLRTQQYASSISDTNQPVAPERPENDTTVSTPEPVGDIAGVTAP
jgi:hypothetical protein